MPNTRISPISPKTAIGVTEDGKRVYHTTEGMKQAVAQRQDVDKEGGLVGATEAQTLTNKTIDGDDNTLQNIDTDSLKTKTGDDANVVTGTAGAASSLTMYNGDGDLVDAGVLASVVVTLEGTQTLTNKTLTEPSITAPTGIVKGDVGLGNVDNTSDSTKNSATATLTNKTFGDAPAFPEYTVAGVPSAATFDNGVIIVSDETGGRTLATSDGTNWRRVSDGAIVS